ncbi:MAG: hypothetical protein JWM93_549 [Frankiales bacterium]|nr:hypothetical protein [Frankiales bacterium]
MPKFLLVIRVDPHMEHAPDDADPTPWWEGANRAGQWLCGNPLQGTETATTVRVRDGRTLVTDGPFAEYKEHIGGFDLIDAPDLATAIERAKGHPVTRFGSVEVREVWEDWPLPDDDSGFAVAREEAKAGLRRYLFVHAEPASEVSAPPPEHGMEGWFGEFLPKGVLVVGHRLHPSSAAATVRTRDGETLVTHGPYAELQEQVAGYDLVEVADLDEALDIAAKHPTSWFSAIEIRPVGTL